MAQDDKTTTPDKGKGKAVDAPPKNDKATGDGKKKKKDDAQEGGWHFASEV